MAGRRVVLDENVPWQLLAELSEHDVSTAAREGWGGVANGELLKRIGSAGFDVFVTADRNLQHQQRLTGRSFGIVLLVPRRLKMEHLRPLLSQIRSAIALVKPGALIPVGPPRTP
jgi:hypothetical protein